MGKHGDKSVKSEKKSHSRHQLDRHPQKPDRPCTCRVSRIVYEACGHEESCYLNKTDCRSNSHHRSNGYHETETSSDDLCPSCAARCSCKAMIVEFQLCGHQTLPSARSVLSMNCTARIHRPLGFMPQNVWTEEGELCEICRALQH